uniref:Uncharacterized protein n=1 Tax=Trichinella nativa TaxID=6335 RepID=A0A0V1JE24_9BILA
MIKNPVTQQLRTNGYIAVIGHGSQEIKLCD